MEHDEPRRTWTVRAVPPRAIVARRTMGVIAAAIGAVAAIGAGFALGRVMRPSTGIKAGLVFAMAAIYFAVKLSRRLPRNTIEATVSVPRLGAITAGGVERAIRSCFYDGADDLLWLYGALGIPRACMHVDRGTACEIADALGCRERGLRTIRALPAPVAIPFVGWLIGMTIGCASLFGLVMLLAGPPHLGVPAGLIAIPLAIAVFMPARVELDERALRWRWWRFGRVFPLSSIERVSATSQDLSVHTSDGRVRRLRVRWASSYAELEGIPRARLASFAAFVESRATAAAFE